MQASFSGLSVQAKHFRISYWKELRFYSDFVKCVFLWNSGAYLHGEI